MIVFCHLNTSDFRTVKEIIWSQQIIDMNHRHPGLAQVPVDYQLMKQRKKRFPYRCAGDALAAGAQRRGVLWRRGQLACEGAVKWRVHVGQRWAGAARVQKKFGGGWRRRADLDGFLWFMTKSSPGVSLSHHKPSMLQFKKHLRTSASTALKHSVFDPV